MEQEKIDSLSGIIKEKFEQKNIDNVAKYLGYHPGMNPRSMASFHHSRTFVSIRKYSNKTLINVPVFYEMTNRRERLKRRLMPKKYMHYSKGFVILHQKFKTTGQYGGGKYSPQGGYVRMNYAERIIVSSVEEWAEKNDLDVVIMKK